MTGRRADIAIAGGGLSGGLIALALRRKRPELDVRLLEAGETLGGNHRWSWFDSDLDRSGMELLSPFRTARWHGYDVRFPAHSRTLSTRYNSLASTDFDAGLRRELAQSTIHTGIEVGAVGPGEVMLANGERLGARTVIDCRGFSPSAHLTGGWQVFMGRHMVTRTPHGIDRPVIMDATVAQLGGYRFVYVLPLGVRDLFIEDTYYQDTPELDRNALSARIDAYARRHGWEGEIVGHETGILPVVTGGDFAGYARDTDLARVPQAGARALLAHPLTSYTLPQAAQTAELVARNADLPSDQLAAMLAAQAKRHWNQTGYYRLLGSMLFGAADPALRYRIFERFYRLDEGLVERFYAARSRLADKARILAGKPPVPIARAIGALVTRRPALVAKDDRKVA